MYVYPIEAIYWYIWLLVHYLGWISKSNPRI